MNVVIDLSNLTSETRSAIATEIKNEKTLEELTIFELSEEQDFIVLLRIIANPNTSKDTLQKIADNAKSETIRLNALKNL